MLEIYNETIRDLLAPGRSSSDMPGGKQYTIKHDSQGNTTVSDRSSSGPRLAILSQDFYFP